MKRLTMIVVLSVAVAVCSSAEGATWEAMDSGTTKDLHGVWGASSDNVFAVGSSGTILQYDATGQWKDINSPTSNHLNSIWGSSGDDIWAVGDKGTILHRQDSNGWQIVSDPDITTSMYLGSIWGTDTNDIYAVGASTSGHGVIVHWDGQDWTNPLGPIIGPLGAGLQFDEIWARSANEVFAVGHNGIGSPIEGVCYRYDGNEWNWGWSGNGWPQTRCYFAIWGAADELFIGAEGQPPDFLGIILQHNGTNWVTPKIIQNSTVMTAIWGTARDDVYMCSFNGMLFHYDGSIWSEMDSGTTECLFGLWGNGPGNVFVVGRNGTILHLSEPVPACWVEQDKLLASDGAADDRFGYSVAISDSTALVGAYGNDDAGSQSGSAYLYDLSDPCDIIETKLTASDAAAFDNFGASVALGGSTVIVGAYTNDDGGSDSGSAYLYDFSDPCNITEIKLTASDAAAGDYFGWRVGISGNTVIVGAYGDDDGGSSSGSAYLFDVSTGNQIAKLTASDAAAGDYFGISVALGGATALVGAYGDDGYTGSAYLYDFSDPCNIIEIKLTASDAAAGDYFGNSVALDGATVVVGAYGDDDGGSSSGSAYLFDVATGNQLAKLTASNADAYDVFGTSVALGGATALVGAYGDDGYTGSAYLYDFSDPCNIIETKLTASDDTDNWFGFSVAISGTTALVGAYGDDTGSISGSAYVFENICEPANISPVADAGEDETKHIGTLVTLNGSGSSDPDENYPLSYSWQIISEPQGSSAELYGPNSVNPSFYPDLEGNYTIQLVVTDSLGLDSQPDSVVISTYNTTPIAEASDDQAIIVLGSTVQLDGSQSYDDDGDDITYLWTISSKPEGSLAELSDPCAVEPNFIADVHGDYIVTLIVTDIFGAVSQPDSMTVSFDNIKPVANPGGNQAVVEGDTVLLDGSGSYDGNGDELSYSWSIVSKPNDSNAMLSDSNAVNLSFIADEPGSYVISLIVNDSFVDSEPANVSVMAISSEEAASGELIDAVEIINNALDPEVLKNKNLAGALTNKINAALELIDQGYYLDALNKLENDILGKTNGCAETGTPDKNDWIETCEKQELVYPFIIQAIEYLEEAIE